MLNLSALIGYSKISNQSQRHFSRKFSLLVHGESAASKKVAKCLLKLPKMISLEKWKIFTPLQKLHNNAGDLGKIIVATGFEKSPKVQ